jgi:hypothetical protein
MYSGTIIQAGILLDIERVSILGGACYTVYLVVLT